jgi:hypothetical protein
MDATTVAIDLAKDVFEPAFSEQLWAMTRDGKPFDGDHVSATPMAR